MAMGMAMEEATIRIRLLFVDEEEILSPSQKWEGLKRCLLQLKSQQHKTISDLTAHILRVFQLEHSCPHGLYLYIDGFALPPFESTGILKSNDVICVRKKTMILSLEEILDGQEAGGARPVKAGNLLPTNYEFNSEVANLGGGMVMAMEEATIRIQLLFDDEDEILSPSQKSVGLNRCFLQLKSQQHKTISDLTAHILCVFQLQHSCHNGLYLYIDGFALPPFESTGILKCGDMISVRKCTTILSLEENLEGQEAGTLMLEFQEDKETDKYAGKDQPRLLETGGNSTPMKRKASVNQHKSKKNKQHSALEDSDQYDATANQVLKPSQDKVLSSQENIQKQEHNLNKITNCSTEISTHTKSSDEIQSNANDALEESVLETKKDQTENVEGEVLNLDSTVDFAKLPRLHKLPKAGDVIVYRVLELSASLACVRSPPRVGKVSWSNHETREILLLPVPEYPIGMSVDKCLYKEDGSLKMLFRELIDVRLLNDGSGGSTVSTEQACG